jgi:hypothetical protein
MNEDDFKEWEFVIVDSELQKKLNQWRHIYLLRIISVDLACPSEPTALIARRKI